MKLWDVKISEFPHEPEWTEAVHATLKTVIDAGLQTGLDKQRGLSIRRPSVSVSG